MYRSNIFNQPVNEPGKLYSDPEPSVTDDDDDDRDVIASISWTGSGITDAYISCTIL
jgi:hypothetical protein